MRRITGFILLGGALAAALLGAAACSDPGAAAPEDWEEFQVWATRELKRVPAPAPLPVAPVLPAPRWPLVRLADRFADAEVVSAWEPAPPGGGTQALAEIGPFRSDESGRAELAVRTVERGTRYGRDALEMAMRGFRLQREEIGAIELELHLPWGGQFMLKWGAVAEVPVPVPHNDGFFTVRLRTDAFPDWEGELNRIILRTAGTGEGVVSVRALRFLPRANAWQEKAGVARARIGRSLRTAVYAHAPCEIRVPGIAVPPGAVFQAGLAVAEQEEGAVSLFEVLVEEDGRRETLLTEQQSAGRPWKDATATLGRWAGREVTLVLRNSAGRGGAVAFWANPVVYQPVEDPPLALLYLIDTLAAEHVGLYGYERETMPRLAGLAQRGTWFAEMFSNSCRTIESVPDYMLSLSTSRHGVFHSSTPAPQELVTLAETLRAAGFATASFSTNPYAGPQQAMDQGFDEFLDAVGAANPRADLTVPLAAVRQWLRKNRRRPCFLYVHTAEPHSPYLPVGEFQGRYDTGYRGAITGSRHPENGFRNARTPAELEHVISLYDAEVAYSDWRMGALLDMLAEEGRAGQATVIVTSDHGEEFLQHGDWEHATNLHGPQTRVPLVVAGPAVAGGRRIDEPAQLLDIMPTVLDLYALPQPYELEGRSLLPALTGTGRPEPRPVFASNFAWMRLLPGLVEFSLIEEGRWKLVFHARKSAAGGGRSHFALYDLAADPGERRSLLAQQPGRARRMILQLLEWRRAQRPFGDGAPPEDYEVDFEDMQELAEMGYLEAPELEGGG